MELDVEARKRISSRAAGYLRDEEAVWWTSWWIVDADAFEENANSCDDIPRDGDTPLAIGKSATIGRIRGWLREHGFGTRNRRCGVCAEGALLLAMAYDESIPDDVVGDRLLDMFLSDANVAAYNLGIASDKWENIVSYNDDVAGEVDDVVRLLNAMGRV